MRSLTADSNDTSPINSFVLRPKSINAKYGSSLCLVSNSDQPIDEEKLSSKMARDGRIAEEEGE